MAGPPRRIWVSPEGAVWVYRETDGKWIPLNGGGGGSGPAGPQGPPGPQGEAGPQGAPGETGSPGAQGADGPAGEAGPPGDTGPPGPQGEPGPVGDEGPQGPPGPTGDPGPAGPEGEAGPQGVKGDTGDAGAQGPPGDDGAAGPQGETGTQGPQGVKGDKGDPGNAGQQGIQGVQGPAGPTGPTVGLVVPLVTPFAATAWTNMPLADTLFNGSHQHVQRVDLTNFTQVRLVVNKQGTAGAAASKIRLGFNAAFQTAVANYAAIGSSEVSATPLNVTNTVISSAWINLVAGAKADVFIALIGSGGDGALDPAFGSIVAQFR